LKLVQGYAYQLALHSALSKKNLFPIYNRKKKHERECMMEREKRGVHHHSSL